MRRSTRNYQTFGRKAYFCSGGISEFLYAYDLLYCCPMFRAAEIESRIQAVVVNSFKKLKSTLVIKR